MWSQLFNTHNLPNYPGNMNYLIAFPAPSKYVGFTAMVVCLGDREARVNVLIEYSDCEDSLQIFLMRLRGCVLLRVYGTYSQSSEFVSMSST
jgi:hypothetical protein